MILIKFSIFVQNLHFSNMHLQIPSWNDHISDRIDGHKLGTIPQRHDASGQIKTYFQEWRHTLFFNK